MSVVICYYTVKTRKTWATNRRQINTKESYLDNLYRHCVTVYHQMTNANQVLSTTIQRRIKNQRQCKNAPRITGPRVISCIESGTWNKMCTFFCGVLRFCNSHSLVHYDTERIEVDLIKMRTCFAQHGNECHEKNTQR